MSDLHDAREQLHAATPAGWYVGRPGQRHGGQRAIYASDTNERLDASIVSRASRLLGRELPSGTSAPRIVPSNQGAGG